MSTEKEQFQQQILFDEQNTEEVYVEPSLTDVPVQQVYFDNDDWHATESELQDIEQQIERRSETSWGIRLAIVVFMLIVGIEAFDFFSTGFIESPFITSLYAILFGVITATVGTSFLKEVAGLSQLKKQIKVQQKIVELNQGYAEGEAVDVCKRIAKKLPCDTALPEDDAWLTKEYKHLSDAEIIQLFNKQVMRVVDQKAMNEIAKHASETMMMVAISPIAFIDMLIVFWRNIAMVDKVAGLYGIKLGYWSRIKLIREVLKNMVFAGATEIIADVGTEMIGADLLGKLSGRAAQGLASGMLTARLGIKTVHLCRPLPFNQDTPSINSVRQVLIGKLKQLVLKKP
ncbi:TIGR01620 family protein [Thalassotalea sp. LPB0316]|uniref:YcjF family protein n=1 Tax=Thalassotalea sp. LPB0316 TaxID=2769490 RepID=UPI001865F385|nr:TIGR01620 family protein [Thalassotalea sp. LPB0316]QOL27143.1 TIGR01620 family protein [Thalassotalea sp. LPB0316]